MKQQFLKISSMCLTSANYLIFYSIKTALKIIFSGKINTSKDALNRFENLNIKQEGSGFCLVDQTLNLEGKLILKRKKGKFTSRIIWDSKMFWVKSFPHKSNYVINVVKSLSEIEYEIVCNDEVNINDKWISNLDSS